MADSLGSTQPASPAANYLSSLSPQQLGILGACAVGILALVILGNQGSGRKSRLATSRWAKGSDRSRAKKRAKQQINGREKNKVTLWVNGPKINVVHREEKPTQYNVSGDHKTIYIPDAQRGMSVIGGSGTGKTFSVIDPVIRSAIAQGFPLCLYDFKYPAQTQRVAALAEAAGYEVNIFAPGFPESQVCNPLDFIHDATDAATARQIAEVLNRNFKLSAAQSDDPFFSNSGDQLVEATLLLAKALPHPDVMTAYTILSDPDLINRLKGINAVNPWVGVAFGQLLSTAKSEKTVASIVSTAALVFTRFMKAGMLPAFCGESTLPLDMTGKRLLIFGMDRNKRDVVGPLVATVLHMVITRNVTRPRTDPLVVVLDELPTLYLPNLVQWLNENREDGLCTLIGYQNQTQLEKAYGKELAQAIFGGTASKFMFNPQSAESADMFSRMLGDEEIRYKSKSRNTGSGKSSITRADQERTRRLFAPEQFNRLPQGHCIYINPAYGSRKEGSVPQKLKIKVTPREIKAQTLSIQCWEQLRNSLISRGIGNTPQDPKAVTIREQEFQTKLPLTRSNDTTMPTGNALTASPQTISRRI
ncbi:type IV secretion system DNA-binding domain-containing protein [Leptothoe sp. LEGE 181152]|nr:type IV secretion system DNA-binding domain-containing protein [Leptothoe sp. LEGE 181152]